MVCDIIKPMKGDDCMENINILLAVNILKYRKKSGLSQEELANKLGVTFQAVSKWELAKSAPDISFLPTMAENLSGNFELTDENIERLLDAYREMYKGMRNKKK